MNFEIDIVCAALGILPSLNKVLNIFLGIVFQALPFLLIGVTLSSFIQVFVSKTMIERLFPKSLLGGMAVAVFGGFFLPVCDCASIPIFRSLVKKGVPMSAAITFMTAAPVINPVAMLSTYYAFGGDARFVVTRIILGILAASGVGAIFHFFPVSHWQREEQGFEGLSLSENHLSDVEPYYNHHHTHEHHGHSCACTISEEKLAGETIVRRLVYVLHYSQREFFEVAGYLLFGAFVTAIIQTFLTISSFGSTSNYVLSIIIMMLMALLLSLCSSSDAVIGKGLAVSFPAGSVMGFLVFGPMMDIKNIILLSGFFSNKFIVRVIFATALSSFVVVLLFGRLLLGVA